MRTFANRESPCERKSPVQSVVRAITPHPERGFLDGLRVAITKVRVESAAVTFCDMALVGVLFIRAVVREGGAETGVEPRVHLFEASNLKDVGATIADGDGA